MVESCDAGSLPFVGNFEKFSEGASKYGLATDEATRFFEKRTAEGFVDKVKAGIDVANYPQYRDMNKMFFDMIEGLEKINGGYVETAALSLKKGIGTISEASVIRNCSKEIHEKLEQPFKLRICVTGPYTMSSFFAFKDKGTFTRLGNVLTQIIENNVFHSKQGGVQLVSVDEPVFGFVDDPLLDRGSEGRENLLKAWESMMGKIGAKGAQACLHLHNTIDELFWETRNLDVIESHVGDPFYQAKRTRELLESMDKSLKASITVTDFDVLIRNRVMEKSPQKPNEISVNEKIADAWKSLNKQEIDPVIFVEDTELMKERLNKIIEAFGVDRVLYAGPECGLRSFPTYDSALECLRRVSRTIRSS